MQRQKKTKKQYSTKELKQPANRKSSRDNGYKYDINACSR